MQTPLFDLVPWWMVVVTLFLAGVGCWGFWRWRYSYYPTRYSMAFYAARDVFITYSLFAVVVLCFAIEIAVKRHERLRELAQFVAPYPGAMPQFLFFKPTKGTWMLETPDSLEKVHAFYSGLADREKVPFRAIRDSDTRFVIGQGTNAVLLEVYDESEDGGDTTVDYSVPAGPQAF